MSSKTKALHPKLPTAAQAPGKWHISWPLLGVLALAAVLRLAGAGQWSLWEDEETAVFFSQNLDRPFPSYFPIYFASLRGVFELTGVSVLAGRVLSAVLGIVGIAATYALGRRVANERVAVWATLFVSLSLGHLFWSQSIRYYILVFLFQVLSLLLYIDAMETGRVRRLVASAVLLLLALWCHFSAILLLPVFVGHILLAWMLGWRHGLYNSRGYWSFVLAFGSVAAIFAWQFFEFRANLAGLISSSASTSIPGLALRSAIYLGVPVLAAALVGVWAARSELPQSIAAFLIVAAWIPLLEIAVIAALNLAMVTWYYAFFALAALAILAGVGCQWCRERWPRLAPAGLAILLFAFHGPILAGYYTSMHGDRPRWKDAAQIIRDDSAREGREPLALPIYATVPGTVAFHLGIDPARTMGHPAVRLFPGKIDFSTETPAGYYVVEQSILNAGQLRWLEEHCNRVAEFPAQSGPKDRTLVVFVSRAAGPLENVARLRP